MKHLKSDQGKEQSMLINENFCLSMAVPMSVCMFVYWRKLGKSVTLRDFPIWSRIDSIQMYLMLIFLDFFISLFYTEQNDLRISPIFHIRRRF